jgi:uncharacterized protein (TIGR02265 family)
MALVDRAIALVAPHCDIVERLAVVPPSAQVRGLYFQSIHAEIEKRGKLLEYEEYFPHDRYSAFPLYPLTELLVRLACAGALVAGPEKVHEGMRLVTKANARAFVDSLLGRLMLRMLSRDPVRLTEQGLAARRQSTTYGHWEIQKTSDHAIAMVYRNEYWWIESALAGAAQGTFEACGVSVETETTLIDRFNGSTHVRW